MSTRPTAAERRWLDRVAQSPCMVSLLGYGAECSGGRELHHLREDEGAAMRAQHTLVVSLCWMHHVGALGIHRPKAFYTRTKLSELDLLAKQIEVLA